MICIATVFQWHPITTSDVIQIAYVFATFGLLFYAIKTAVLNKRQITAAVASLKQSQDQFEERNRANVVVSIQHIKTAACLVLKNTGTRMAQNVSIEMDDSIISSFVNNDLFKDARNNFLKAIRDIAPGQRIYYPLWNQKRINYDKMEALLAPLVITINFESEQKKYSNEFHISLNDEYLINTLPEERIAVALEKIAGKEEKKEKK